MVYYIGPRVVEGIWEYFKRKTDRTHLEGFPFAYVLAWGLVMYLYELDKKILNRSLVSSMEYIYKESDGDLASWRDLLPLDILKLSRRRKEKLQKKK